MKVNEIYHGADPVYMTYHGGEIVYQRDPVIFQEIDTFVEADDTLIVWGACIMNPLPDCLYLDCVPEWVYPVQNGNVLTIERVYRANLNGNVLEVE